MKGPTVECDTRSRRLITVTDDQTGNESSPSPHLVTPGSIAFLDSEKAEILTEESVDSVSTDDRSFGPRSY
jgi:hypothetical protein